MHENQAEWQLKRLQHFYQYVKAKTEDKNLEISTEIIHVLYHYPIKLVKQEIVETSNLWPLVLVIPEELRHDCTQKTHNFANCVKR